MKLVLALLDYEYYLDFPSAKQLQEAIDTAIDGEREPRTGLGAGVH